MHALLNLFAFLIGYLSTLFFSDEFSVCIIEHAVYTTRLKENLILEFYHIHIFYYHEENCSKKDVHNNNNNRHRSC